MDMRMAACARRVEPGRAGARRGLAARAVDLVGGSRALREPGFCHPGSRFAEAVRRPFPICALRYGLMRAMIEDEAARRDGLRVCEVGVDRGQLLRFMEEAPPAACATWDALDIAPRRDDLVAAGYSRIAQGDAQRGSPELPGPYDVVVACHVLEHLPDPDAAVGAMAAMLAPGGALIGGFPVVPWPLAPLRQRRLRRRPRGNGHVSAFSPPCLAALARRHGLAVELATGAFLMRCRGFALERYRWWARFNLAWGRALPGLGNELYFRLRRTG